MYEIKIAISIYVNLTQIFFIVLSRKVSNFQLEGSCGKSIHRCVTLLSRRIFFSQTADASHKKVSQKENFFVNLAEFFISLYTR